MSGSFLLPKIIFKITPTVRYPSDDQTPVTREDALRYAEAANEVYNWVIQKHDGAEA